MFKTFKILWLELTRRYHYHMVHHYDRKAYRQKAIGYCGIIYNAKAWRHLHQALKLNEKLHKLKGI